MTDISVTTTAYQAEDRSWLLSQWGQGPGENPNVVLDISAFTEGTHYPNGYIPSGHAPRQDHRVEHGRQVPSSAPTTTAPPTGARPARASSTPR